jgi:hypothetical protein
LTRRMIGTVKMPPLNQASLGKLKAQQRRRNETAEIFRMKLLSVGYDVTQGAAPRKSGRFIIEDTLKQRDEMRITPALVGRERFRPASATRRPDR